ncbi:hypothetical protein EON82_02880 [bacterium]|nr:MAG: hypothetical protein EON82_02880 [bacterium]
MGEAVGPTDIPGLGLWLDASDASTLFQDTAAATPALANFDSIAAWRDKSGLGRHATQATTARRPALASSALNGRNAVRFDEVDDTLAVSGAGSIAQSVYGITVFVVTIPRALPAGMSLYISTANPAASRSWLSLPSAAQHFGRRLDADTGQTLSFGTLTAGTPVLVTDHVDLVNNLVTGYLSGTSLGQVAYQTGAPAEPTSNTASGSVQIGSLNGSSTFANQDLGEIVVFSRALTSAERRAVEGYLRVKWGIV